MARLLTAAIGATMLIAINSSAEGPKIREYEDAIVVSDGDRPALRIGLGKHPDTGYAKVDVSTLYDPYGEPYVADPRQARLPSAIDWGAESCRVGDRQLGPYLGDTPYRTFERWIGGNNSEGQVELTMQRAWIDPASRQAFVLETAQITVFSQQYYRRSIDIRVQLVNIGDEPVELPADAGFLVRFDANRPQAGYRTPENEYRSAPFRYRGPWLSASSMALSRMKMMGVALFNNALNQNGEAATFVADDGGVLRMHAAPAATLLEPGERAEWSTRVFCYADTLPARAIQDSYLGYLTGRTW